MTTPDTTPVRPLPQAQQLPVTEVREAEKNPRRIPERAVELVAQSIRRFGWQQPLVVDRDRYLIVGHTRYRAAQSMGLTHVPVVIAEDLTPEEVRAYRIADNRTHDFTSWDLPGLAQELEDLSAEFGDVLALADWEVVSARMEEAAERAGGDAGDVEDGLPELDLPRDVKDALDGGFQVNVCFHTKEQALAAQLALMELPGVFDVRHDF